ncbi:hypothetical protein VB796_03300 [Arcicella sp. LKC2W]|uniref:hypothetical protein n=1 Tax=Arcicella sp. LKC2W TaxID=2984198 RepID=UPI002B21AC8C|nr:hypothetical protein [Arcicella sp. LKC2W]MEA5458044.1 hypothetical protein [Arcicella sp. LKC2W]
MKKTLSILFLIFLFTACKTDEEKDAERFIGMFGKSTWNIKKIVYYNDDAYSTIDSTINFQNSNIYFSEVCLPNSRICEGTQTIYGQTAKLQYDPKSYAYDRQVLFSTYDPTIKPIFTLQGTYDVEELDTNKRIFSGIVKAYEKNKWAKIYLEK